MLPSIEPGKRAIIAGRTGSGKTTLGAWLLSRTRQKWLILNPKHTAGYSRLPDSVSLSKLTESNLERALKKSRFVVLNFAPNESNHLFMDDLIYFVHETYNNIGLVADELYTLHNNSRPGQGLTAWLTRGREKKQSFIGLTQRPAWISRFCFSEADYICGMTLNLDDDRKSMVANTGHADFLERLAPRQWRWYNVQRDVSQLWGAVPLTLDNEHGRNQD